MGEYEDYKEILERQNGSSSKIFNNIKPLHILIIAGISLVLYQMTKSNENNTVLYVIAGASIILYLFSMTRGAETSKVIPRGLAEKIALQDLRSEIRPDGSYPMGTAIYPTSYFKDQSIDTGEGMKLFKYNIGFKINRPGQSERNILYQMNPFSGESKGIVDMPMGFDGQDVKDIQLVFPEATKTETKPNT